MTDCNRKRQKGQQANRAFHQQVLLVDIKGFSIEAIIAARTATLIGRWIASSSTAWTVY
jgi:hypothetical protein